MIGKGAVLVALVAVATYFATPYLPLEMAEKLPWSDVGSGRVVVIGGGLAGMSAALEAAEAGAEVVLLEKEPKLGGNSAKASSGINAVGTAAQKAAGSRDNRDVFVADTRASGAGQCSPELVDKLVRDSSGAVAWLQGHGVNLDVLSQCGGHSYPRTHRSKPREDGRPVNVGLSITKVLAAVVEKHPRIRVETGARVVELVVDPIHTVITVVGAKYSQGGLTKVIRGDAVVLASGGFGASRGPDSMLAKYAPEIANLSTTNGPWATGDGMRLGHNIGANLVQMGNVQVHPTGFVDPNDPTAGTKFLAPEALRASGGVLINAKGKRFVNELGLRDHVTKQIFANGDPYTGPGSEDKPAAEMPTVARMLLNEEAYQRFGAAMLGFYRKKGFVITYDNAEALALANDIPAATLRATLEAYNKNAPGTADEFGKTVFPTKIDPDATVHMLTITPVIHYCMGGLHIDTHANVLRHGRPIAGLFAAGEVTGGVHGANRLAGNSLLDCTVYGRQAGQSAAAHKPAPRPDIKYIDPEKDAVERIPV